MASEALATLRHAATPFLAGAAAVAAGQHGFYATMTVAVLVALWAGAPVARGSTQVALAPTPASAVAVATDPDEVRRLRLQLDLSPAPLVSLGANGRLRAVNRAARRLFGADDLIVDAAPDLIGAVRDTAPGETTTVRVARRDDERAFAVVTGDIDGPPERVRVGALIDIEADLRAAEASTFADLVKVLSHEVTNTLTPIASLSATASAMLDDPSPDLVAVREAADTVARRALGLQRFGEAYRDLARLPPPSRRQFDLVALVDDLTRLFRTRWPDVALRVSSPDAIHVGADPDQLAQGIWALLQNAAEAGRTVHLELAPSATGASLVVGDDGPGVPPEDVERIFRPFFTTKAEGSGIGLSLTRRIFQLHGGDLRLKEASPSAVFEGHI